tara:strand:+ start:3462 stop:4055 length:594 start_codon:yes stop_codon:yes gene_type:complete
MKKSKERLNNYWPFQLDEVEDYAYAHGCFSSAECEQIIKINKDEIGLHQGVTRSKTAQDRRDAFINWMQPSDIDYVFPRLTRAVVDLNAQYFKFNLTGFSEGVQFTHYKAPSGKYDKHTDSSLNTRIRKLTCVTFLNDPATYEGGDLLLYYSDDPARPPNAQGTTVIFPSYVLHQVTPVTKGERNVLVTWATGPSFK